MRRRNPSDITVNEETISVDKNGHASYIDFSNEQADIIILAYQPGIGKTYNILEYMKSNPSSFYFTDRHKVIQDNTRKWDEQNIEYAHWEGFGRKCKNSRLKNIVDEYGLIPSIACSHCSRRRCSYRGQFTRRERVFAPFEYLPINHVMSDLPDIIFLDENKVKVDTASFNQNQTVEWLETISHYSDVPNNCIQSMREGNHAFFTNEIFRELSTYHREAQDTAFEGNHLDDVRIIGRINPYSLKMYFKFAETYHDFQRGGYYIPFWYHAFEVVNSNKKVVFLDASFNKDWFKYMLECFNGEVGFDRVISVQIYTTNEINHNTIVYNMRHNAERASWMPRESIRRYIMTWFPQHLKKIKEIYGEENVGLITFKEVVELKNKKYFELFDTPFLGNLRSSNAFEDKRVLVVLGTYFGMQNQLFENLEKIFDVHNREQIVEEEETRQSFVRAGFSDFLRPLHPDSLYNTVLRPKRRRRFTDSQPLEYMGDGDPSNYDNLVMPVDWLQSGIWDSEMYQAFHRNRGLQNNRVIFGYCWFPAEILKEFHIESVNRDVESEQAFWDKLENQEIERNLMNSLVTEISLSERPLKMKTHLSEKYRMFGGENRDRIEQFINKYLEIKERIRPPRK